MNAKKKTAPAPKAVDAPPRIVAGTAVAVGSDVSTEARRARKQLLEDTFRVAIQDAIAESEAAGDGFPSDAVLKQAQKTAYRGFQAEPQVGVPVLEVSSQHMTARAFAALIRSRPQDELILALEQVETEAGALRVYRAEADGRRRWRVLLTATRRIEQLGGTERLGVRTSLIAEGIALEPGQK